MPHVYRVNINLGPLCRQFKDAARLFDSSHIPLSADTPTSASDSHAYVLTSVPEGFKKRCQIMRRRRVKPKELTTHRMSESKASRVKRLSRKTRRQIHNGLAQ